MHSPDARWVVRMVEEQTHRDDDGRPLREGRTPEAYLRDGEIEYRACPYPGSRHAAGLPMNVSALRQTTARWDELACALAFVRTAYVDARGGGESVPDLMDVWRTSQLACALPWFFVLRGEPLPAYAAALSKAALGTGILAQRLLHDQLARRWTPPAGPLTAAALLALAESTGTLVGGAEVCAAPEPLIARFLEVLVAGTPTRGLAAVEPLIAQRDRVVSFGACYAGLKLSLWIYYLARRFLLADVAAARDSAEARALLAAPCEPPDFYVIEPAAPAQVPGALRAAWLGQLAALIVPFAPDGSDRAIRACAARLAAAMASEIADPIARAVAVFAELDAIAGELFAAVEAGLRGEPQPRAASADAVDRRFDAEARDRLIASSPRALLARLG